MAKINTLNYQIVASWNGSQDLFIVEQPDDTKVATPAMVKQFIEAGDFEATGEVKDGHGNKLADMAKSVDVSTALAGKQDTLTFDDAPTASSNNPVKSGGIFSTMAVPKYDSANRREYYEGGAAFSGNIDSTPTAGSNNAVSSGGTKTYVDNAVSQLNDEIGVITRKTSGTITVNSGYTSRRQNLVKVNGIVYGVFIINTTNVISGRVTIGSIPSGFRPQMNVAYLCPASDSINGYQNRATNVIITTNGEIVVGDIFVPAGQTIKEIFCAFAYNQGN